MAALFRRYGVGARWYDILSGEWLVYGAGREAGIRMLAPERGDVVIDLGCGTGLNFPLLASAIGPEGLIIGIDRSVDMLAMAQRRVEAAGLHDRVRLVSADAAELNPDRIADLSLAERGRREVDGLISTYALSVIADREEAWRRASGLVRSGGKACIVDMQLPTGRWRAMGPLARLACAAGGSDIRSRAWTLLERAAVPDSLQRSELKGGHLVVVAGTLP